MGNFQNDITIHSFPAARKLWKMLRTNEASLSINRNSPNQCLIQHIGKAGIIHLYETRALQTYDIFASQEFLNLNNSYLNKLNKIRTRKLMRVSYCSHVLLNCEDIKAPLDS